MRNEIIKNRFIELEKHYTSKLNSIKNLENLLKELLSDLKRFDLNSYRIKLKKEINTNLKEWWINPEKGIIKTEELFAILFEYGHFFEKNIEAETYGIGEWKNYAPKTAKFDMGFDYDFTTEFYACPGISLDFFNPLEKLNNTNLTQRNEDDLYKTKGCYELIELYKITGYRAIQEVLVEMDLEGVFEILNYKNNFMFIIDEHDSGEVYPLLIKEKN